MAYEQINLFGEPEQPKKPQQPSPERLRYNQGPAVEAYQRQWGTATHDDVLLFQLLAVGMFQSGLTWWEAAGKRDVFRRNFCEMVPTEVAKMTSTDIEKALVAPGMIPDRRKAYALVTNAQALYQVQSEFGSFATYLWGFVNNQPIINAYQQDDDIPTTSPIAQKVARDLKQWDFKYVGPIVTTMFLRASGLIVDQVLPFSR
ncbi:DNA-3-methyladenine glycosylase I [Loigolactobacillus iwatensis]|uniref:DNA-3-methyladenine glycosylase I n=1 Tax=Loigolactobacillus iwatensis TaxID=1267156 RepID=UPI000F7D91AA|nr:DNA-3-methyladenine glycosylase I [Loigolactobacillus iwatensis]